MSTVATGHNAQNPGTIQNQLGQSRPEFNRVTKGVSEIISFPSPPSRLTGEGKDMVPETPPL
jgi:hypothetical protein